MCKKTKLDRLLIIIHKTKLQWVKDLNIILKTIKSLQENISSKISDISCAVIFFLIHLLGQRKQKRKKWDYIKPKSFCAKKETINKMKREPTEWEN